MVGSHCFDAVAHAFRLQRIGAGQLGKVGGVFEGVLFTTRHHVAFVDDFGAEPLRLPVGIRHGVHLIDAELASTDDVGLGQDTIVGGKGAVVTADVLGGKLHEDGQPGEVVNRFSLKRGEVAFERFHGHGLG